MTIYLNGVELDNVCILPAETEVLDETLDGYSLSIVNSSPAVIKPMTRVKVVHDDNTVSLFIVSADSVEPFSLEKDSWKHTLSCTENTRILSKLMVRNSVFSQPPMTYREGQYALCAFPKSVEGTRAYTYQTWEHSDMIADKLSLGNKEKCSKAYIKINLQVGISNTANLTDIQAISHNDYKSVSDINSAITSGSVSFPKVFYISYKINGLAQSMELDVSALADSDMPFNTYIECPQIKNLLNQGATDLYVYPNNGTLLTCDQAATGGYHAPFVSAQIKVRADVYYNSCYDILDLLLKRQRQSVFVNGSMLQKADPFALPQSGELHDLLVSTPAPNFVFTQCTLYECVAEVFRIFDAIFTMDENGVLGITYFNKRGATQTKRMSGINLALGEERYINGFISYYQDARSAVDYPSKKAFAPIRSKVMGVPKENDFCFEVAHPIHYVTEAEVKTTIKIEAETGNEDITVSNFPLQIEHYVIEKSLWGLLPVDDVIPFNTPNTQKQNNTVYFSEDDNKIELSFAYDSALGLTYYTFGNMMKCAVSRQLGYISYSIEFSRPVVLTPDADYPAWGDVFMRVSYVASLDGRFEIQTVNDKFDGQIVIDQSNGAIDLGNLGMNMLGLSYKMGEPSMSAVYKPSSWADRIKKGDVISYDGGTWVANACISTYLGKGMYQERVNFVKNYNEISLRKKLLQEKRLSSISAPLTMKSEDNIIEYCYVADNSDAFSAINIEKTIFNKTVFKNCIANTFGITSSTSSIGHGVFQRSGNGIYLPCARYGGGNSICFEFSFNDPILAGLQMTANAVGWFGSTDYYTNSYIYPDADGFCEYAKISLAYDDSQDFNHNFPKIPIATYDCFGMDRYYIFKQPNEIFALNYEISFIPTDHCFIGRKFIESNFFISGELQNRKFYVHQSADLYSVCDQKAKGDRAIAYMKTINVTGDGKIIILAFYHSLMEGEFNSWAIADEDGNLFFASNEPFPNQTAKGMYLTLRRSRI